MILPGVKIACYLLFAFIFTIPFPLFVIEHEIFLFFFASTAYAAPRQAQAKMLKHAQP